MSTAQYLRTNDDGGFDFVIFTGHGMVTIKRLTEHAIETILNTYTALQPQSVTPVTITILLEKEPSS